MRVNGKMDRNMDMEYTNVLIMGTRELGTMVKGLENAKFKVPKFLLLEKHSIIKYLKDSYK